MSFLDLFRSHPRRPGGRDSSFSSQENAIAGTQPGQEREIQRAQGREPSGTTPVTRRKKRDTMGPRANRPSRSKARSHRTERSARVVRTSKRANGKKATGRRVR